MMEAKRIFTASPAVREQVPLLIGLVGSSGSGKTYSALRLATGIQRALKGPIVLIDTENRRALHYADQFNFVHIPFTPPFGANDYMAALRYAASLKPSCIIVDSGSHEHTGEGGLLDAHDKILDRMAGDDFARREKSSMAAWAKVKPMRTLLIECIKQMSGAMIFCFRGQEKLKPMKDSKGRMELVPQGLTAIAGKEFIYEMTVNCLLPPRSDGVPDWTGTEQAERLEMKLPQQFRNLLKPGTVLSEDIGQAMADWARGGVPSASSSAAPAASLPQAPSQDDAGAFTSPHAVSIHAPKRDSVQTPEQHGEEMTLRAQIEADLTAAIEGGEAAYRAAWSAAMRQYKAFPDTRLYFVERRDSWLAAAKEVDKLRAKRLDDGAVLGEARLTES